MWLAGEFKGPPLRPYLLLPAFGITVIHSNLGHGFEHGQHVDGIMHGWSSTLWAGLSGKTQTLGKPATQNWAAGTSAGFCRHVQHQLEGYSNNKLACVYETISSVLWICQWLIDYLHHQSPIGSPLFDTLTQLFKLIGHFFGKSMPWHDTAECTHQPVNVILCSTEASL